MDPLRLIEPTEGEATWKVSLGYSASGRRGFEIDDTGSPYGYELIVQDWTLSFFATTGLGTTSSVGASASLLRTSTAESRQYADLAVSIQATQRGMACAVWHQTRLDTASETDPRLTIAIEYPTSASMTIAGAILSDPMVLAAQFGLRCRLAAPALWLALELSAGFVANRLVQVSSLAGVDVPVDAVGVPNAHMGCEVQYSLSSSGFSVGVRATLQLTGELPRLIAEVELGG